MTDITIRKSPAKLLGAQIKVGDAAPDFECVHGLEVQTLRATPKIARLFSVVTSLDMSVCAAQTKTFDELLASLGDTVRGYTVSLDLPFAQRRFCVAENVSTMRNLSDARNKSFGKSYGVLIDGLPVPLLTRAVFVVDSNDKITHVEYVSELTNHPDYDAALAALKAAQSPTDRISH